MHSQFNLWLETSRNEEKNNWQFSVAMGSSELIRIGLFVAKTLLAPYRADWEPEAPSGRRALSVFWRCSAVLWGSSTLNPTQISWKTLILKNWPIFLRHVDMWWFCPMWPKCAFGDQKCLIRNKDMPFGNPSHHGTKNSMRTFRKNRFFYFFCLSWVKKWCFGSKKR